MGHSSVPREVLANEAAYRRSIGRLDFVRSTALDYGVSRQTVTNAMHAMGIPVQRGRPGGGTGALPADMRVRLTPEECKNISWCPECGHIYIYLQCEWCANWGSNVRAAGALMLSKLGHQKALKRKKARIQRRQRWSNFHKGDPPPKETGWWGRDWRKTL
jgi:hypothetical protein